MLGHVDLPQVFAAGSVIWSFMDIALSQLLPALLTGSVALFAYLIKFYFQKIADSNIEVRQEIAKLEGKLDLLSKDIRDNTIESAATRSEVKALWRFVDNSNQRATDRRAS